MHFLLLWWRLGRLLLSPVFLEAPRPLHSNLELIYFVTVFYLHICFGKSDVSSNLTESLFYITNARYTCFSLMKSISNYEDRNTNQKKIYAKNLAEISTEFRWLHKNHPTILSRLFNMKLFLFLNFKSRYINKIHFIFLFFHCFFFVLIMRFYFCFRWRQGVWHLVGWTLVTLFWKLGM